MTQITDKKYSIYFQLVKLLTAAALAASLAFFLLNAASEYLMDNFYYASGYAGQKDEQYIRELQEYIDTAQLSSRDTDRLSLWIRKQKLIQIRIYKDGNFVFDSRYPAENLWEEDILATEESWETYYTVDFTDGPATISIDAPYAYQFYNYVLIAELLISFLLFLVLVLAGIRKKIRYILTLSDEIEILEGGSLDYQITIRGKDELSALAEGLEHMRLSFRRLIEQESEIMKKNQRIIMEMSHDLRTPVTSILLYAEILKKGKYKDASQLADYIEKIYRKAHRMKQLADHLFEYSLITEKADPSPEPPETVETLFYDLFSETCSYLEQKGYSVVLQITWPDKKIRIFTDYLIRIMDNITSNVIKYADPRQPVVISSAAENQMTGFSFENHIQIPCETVESTEIGIQSIQNMMAKMNGTCHTEHKKQLYRITLLFPEVTQRECKIKCVS